MQYNKIYIRPKIMNESSMDRFSWKISHSKDMTTYQLFNGLLVDVQAHPIGKFKILPYDRGRQVNASSFHTEAETIERMYQMSKLKIFS